MVTGSTPLPMYIADCPRCSHAQVTFDILASVYAGKIDYDQHFECFLHCRSCFRTSIALLRQIHSRDSTPMSHASEYVGIYYELKKWVFTVPSKRDVPPHVPEEIARIFNEAAPCAAIGAWDAAGTMFRKVLDVATRKKTPSPESEDAVKPSSWKTFKDLRLRLNWLFENGFLDRSLEDLSSCIHADGNDAAHDVNGIGRQEAEDLSDFCDQLLRVVYTTPGQIQENRSRREARRGAV